MVASSRAALEARRRPEVLSCGGLFSCATSAVPSDADCSDVTQAVLHPAALAAFRAAARTEKQSPFCCSHAKRRATWRKIHVLSLHQSTIATHPEGCACSWLARAPGCMASGAASIVEVLDGPDCVRLSLLYSYSRSSEGRHRRASFLKKKTLAALWSLTVNGISGFSF